MTTVARASLARDALLAKCLDRSFRALDGAQTRLLSPPYVRLSCRCYWSRYRIRHLSPAPVSCAVEVGCRTKNCQARRAAVRLVSPARPVRSGLISFVSPLSAALEMSCAPDMLLRHLPPSLHPVPFLSGRRSDSWRLPHQALFLPHAFGKPVSTRVPAAISDATQSPAATFSRMTHRTISSCFQLSSAAR